MKLKTKKLLFTLLGVASLLFYSCQKDDFENNYSSTSLKFTNLKFNDALKDPKFRETVSNLNLGNNSILETKLSKNNSKVSESIIIYDDVKIIQTDKSINYNFYIERGEQDYLFFENLVISIDLLGNKSVYFAKYEKDLNQETLINNVPFKNVILTPYSYNNLPYSDPIVQNTMQKCAYVDISNCSGDPYDCAGDICGFHTVAICGSGGDSGDSSNPYGNSGGNTTQTTGGAGGTGSGTVHTSPVVSLEQQQRELINKTNCEKLNKLTASTNNLGQPITNNVRNALILNQQQVSSSNVEQGFRLFMDAATGNLIPSPVTNTSTQDCGALTFNSVQGMVGFFHSHTAGCGHYGLFEMFSHKDVLKLYEIIQNHNYNNYYGNNIDASNFVMTVASEYGTYALKITDIDAFKNIISDLYSDEKKIQKFLDRYAKTQSKNAFDSLGNPTSSSGKNEENMLNMINNLLGGSVSLHKAKSNFSGWDRLELVNGIVTPKSCN